MSFFKFIIKVYWHKYISNKIKIKIMINERPAQLIANSIYYDIYRYIWFITKGKNKINAKISDTVLFLGDIPILWVFTAKDGFIKRKNPIKLETNYIINHFLRKNNEIIGHYMYSSEENREIKFTTINEEENLEQINLMNDYFDKIDINIDDKNNEKSKLNFEILDREKFINLLMNKKKRCGVLQSYVQSTNLTNYMFKIIWTPNFSICDVRNARQPKNKNVHIFEKSITFETNKLNIETSK